MGHTLVIVVGKNAVTPHFGSFRQRISMEVRVPSIVSGPAAAMDMHIDEARREIGPLGVDAFRTLR